MIYSIHGYYRKLYSRKQEAKIEALVFAADSNLARQLVEDLFNGYPAELEAFTVSGGLEKDLNKIYAERPELRGINPEIGYIYNRAYLLNCIQRYYR